MNKVQNTASITVKWTLYKKKNTYLAPIESIVQINGLLSSPNLAITGWQKYGPNLRKATRISFPKWVTHWKYFNSLAIQSQLICYGQI